MPEIGTEYAVLTAISRYPVKSMLGEEPPAAEVLASGVAGDRGWALVDAETGHVVSAKRPRLWGRMLALRARYPGGPRDPVHIELPDRSVVAGDDPEADARLSDALGRKVRLDRAPGPGSAYETVWPDVDGVAPEEFIAATRTSPADAEETVGSMPVGLLAPGTFQDLAPVTILTTASLRAAARLYPGGDWDPRRFRSTLLLDVPGDAFVEQGWVGRRIRIGDAELDVTMPIPRCVMTTLAQQDLPQDAAILRTLAGHNRLDVTDFGRFACLGVYATVVRQGVVSVGQPIAVS